MSGGVAPLLCNSAPMQRWTLLVPESLAFPALMEAYAVNRAVNSVKNDTEDCIEAEQKRRAER